MDPREKLRSAAPAPTLNRAVLCAVPALIGFTAIIAQIVLMRELMVVFCGNEISLGLTLANWLLWTAVGGSLFGRLAARALRPRRLMAALQILVSVALPCTIGLVRASRGAFQAVPGETLGPGPMFLTSLVSLSLFCATSGCLFAAGSRLYADETGTTAGAGTSAVYLLEAIGSGAGGFVATFLLIPYLDAFAIAFVLSLLNLVAATSLLAVARWQRHALVAGWIGVFGLVAFPILSPHLEAFSRARLWQGFHLVTTRNSIYGNLAVVQTGASRSLYESGLVLFTVPDPAAAEEAVHYALLQHPSPRSLLLVGGGVNGSLSEALRHPSLSRIDYAELDPAMIDLARKYFSQDWNPIQADSRVRVHNTDGRLFVKIGGEKFDVIVVNLPDPQTAQLNRFYTAEFFGEVAGRLNPDGVFSFQLRAAENYISPELAGFLQCINKTLRVPFPAVTAIPGETVHFFAATRTGILAAGPQELVSRLRSRGIRTSYVREYYIPFRMSHDRMLDLDQQIRPSTDTSVNRDFTPVAYYFAAALWSSRFDQHYRRLFEAAAHVRFAWMATSAGLLLLALGVALKSTGAKGRGPEVSTRRPLARNAAGFCIAAMGFNQIGLEMLLLLAFQAIYGYVYYQLAVLVAAFMAGMAFGCWWKLRRLNGQRTHSWLGGSRASGLRMTADPESHPERSEELALGAAKGSAFRRESDADLAEHRGLRTLAWLQTLAALSPLVLYMLLVFLAPIKGALGLWMVSQVVFPALAALFGLLGGYQFPVASRIFFAGSAERTSSPGALYGLDLVGACVAAVMLSTYVVPVFGFLRTALFMGVVNLAPTGLASLAAFECRAPET